MQGEEPQRVVPAGVWQAARPVETAARGGWSPCGCTVAPGFEFADFEMPPRALLARMPHFTDVIRAPTRDA